MRLVGWTSVRANRRQALGWTSSAIAGAIQVNWAPRIWAAAFFWAIAIPFLYEGYAILFRNDPTISRMMSYQLTAHGWYIGIPIAFLLGGVACILIAHFVGLIPVWAP
jgi:hypothetical protein